MTRTVEGIKQISVRLCTAEAEPAWDSFVSRDADGTIFHRFGWKEIFERVYGNECIYLMAEESGTTVGILPLVFKKSRLFGKFLVSLPYFDCVGICCDREDVRRTLFMHAQELCKERNAEYIELRHDREHGLDVLTKQSKVAMMLELPSNPEELWSRLKAKVRNQVRKAEKEELSVVTGRAELVDAFFKVYVTNMRDLGSPSHCRDFFEQICEIYPEAVRILCIRLGEKAVASGFTIASKETLTIPWASSLRKYNSKCPNMLLYWNALKYACECGFSQFSFGRSTPDEGTYQFKKQWGAEPRPLYWQYWLSNGGRMPDLSMKNSKYNLPVRVWRAMPVAVTKNLGPKLIQNLA
jgi:serine/alanine adding enzyme